MEEELARLLEASKIDPGAAAKIGLLPPGTFCHHKSWGVGQVASWDLLGDRIVVNFEGKPDHSMKLQFAAGALVPLPDGHILSRRFHDGAGLRRLSEEDPVELVRLALASYGNSLSLDEFDGLVKGSVVPDGRYKTWWDNTKKKLRTDRRFVVPTKRTLPLQLRGEDQSATEEMLKDVLGTADLKAKAKGVEAILRNPDVFAGVEEVLLPLLGDLHDSAQRAAKLMLGASLDLILVRADLIAKFPSLQAADSGSDAASLLPDLLRQERDQLGDTIRSLAIARQRQVLEAFPTAFGEDWVRIVLGMLNTAGLRGTGELAKFLVDQGRGPDLEEFLRSGLQQRALSSDLIAWICKERKGRAVGVVGLDLAAVIMNSLERDHFGDETRRTNRLAETLQEDPDLIPDLIREGDLNMVRGFTRRLIMSPAFDQLTVKSLLARIVKLHPEVQDLITGQQGEEKEAHLIVSWASLEAKQKEMDQLINVLQPRNREEIKIAREYGDLRENFEYKAAKQQEAVLRRQREELEQDLQRARGSDFSEPDLTRCSIGTTVEVEDAATGARETYTILGAWDSDPARSIIAYTTGAGRALVGKVVGEPADLPVGEDAAPRRVTVVSIRPYHA